ncbi:hypothetical protein TH61_11915 [Rufibacter sp. DG15C]|uniref:hypothetical protein n=1 Tax=Rufibacter sp. DG15C TaxID=1379909 RepID=UPI00078EEEB4|nr:hypothetical protein [Rufibacter sp. DG15C]AMM51742.1 hypothetical protein TH61_11915 [Rufibacter sp. DG15C]
MKKTLSILGILGIVICQATPLQESIRIGKFTYKTKKDGIFLKDESYHCKTFTLYSQSGEPQAGLIIEAMRNDTLFVSGTYQIESSKFIAKNYYHYRYSHEPDSSVKTFVQNSKGKLELRSFIEFTGGVKNAIKLPNH